MLFRSKESFLDSPKVQQAQPMLGQNMGPKNPRNAEPVGNEETLVGTATETGENRGVPTPQQASRAQAQKMADTTVGKIGPLDRNPERMRVPEGPKATVYRNPGVGSQAHGPPRNQAEEVNEAQKEKPTEPLQKRMVKEDDLKKKDDPWEQAKKAQETGKSSEWQPKAWTPPAAAPRR